MFNLCWHAVVLYFYYIYNGQALCKISILLWFFLVYAVYMCECASSFDHFVRLLGTPIYICVRLLFPSLTVVGGRTQCMSGRPDFDIFLVHYQVVSEVLPGLP
jgi:hypothetical protein